MLTIKIKVILAVTLIFTLFLGLSLVSASDINNDDTVSLTENNNNIKTSSNNIEIDDVENNIKNDNNEDRDSPTIASTSAGNGEIVKEHTNAKTISELNETINSGNSSIILDSNYTYNEHIDSRFRIDGGIVLSRDLTIDGQGHTIDLGEKIRFLNIKDHSITLKNINIINGIAYNSGGVINIQNGTITIINSTFNNNKANNGGVIQIWSGSGNITNSTFNNNTAKEGGGAIRISRGSGNITNSTFNNNTANSIGGAILISNSNGTITNSTFNNNTAINDGGAIHITSSNSNITNSTFNNNTAFDEGGAIEIFDSNVTIINSTFNNNTAINDGGAIEILDKNVTIINSTFNNNTASAGGAIFYENGTLNVNTSKFTDNNGNIVYTDNNDDIYVDNTTRSLSDPDLIRKATKITVQLNNYTYESEGSIFCNVSWRDETIYGIVYVIIGNKTYTGYIMEGTGSIALPDISAGNYTLNIIYNGTNTRAKSKTLANLTVYKKDVNMNVSASNITYTEDGLINIKFNQNVEGLAYIIYDNKTYAVNISGDSGVINVPGLIPGVYNFDVYFDSLNYNTNMKTVSFNVFKKDPEMNVSVANITYGEDAVIFVNFAEKLNCTVYVIYNNVNYTGNITNGKGNITIKNLNANDYNLNIIFDGTILYNTTTTPATFTIFKINSTISVTADDVEYGNAILVNVTTDCEDGDIYLVINNQTYTGYIRNGVGIINIANLEPGYYNTNVTYNGSINYNPCVSPVNFTVEKQNATVTTKIDIDGNDVLITVFTNGDDSVAYITINNVTYSTNIVNLTGVINITGLKPGYYESNVTYNGTKYYNPCNTPVNFTIDKNESSITVNVEDVVYPGDVILNVTTDCDDGLIFVELNGQNYTGNIIRGNGYIIVPGLEPGFYELNVTYNGSDRYNPCVVPVNFNVLKQNATVISNFE
ncbi:beta strand repeat-containing protein, partial [Methanobrevibacter sp.]